ncbi:acyl-CoA thioesterase II, partial [Streptococcus pseudopneumoniae]
MHPSDQWQICVILNSLWLAAAALLLESYMSQALK